ncbi:response regulator transcription factor [Euzebya sp.]|uniref:response regulator transcription factor n=1 Tax=Euzebya sp. TaxID=1971409 RepID=UPI003512AADB
MSEAPTILTVDDEVHIRELVRMGLAVHGYHVVEAADGRGALEALAAHEPDLVVLDVMMPGLDGFEVARRIRAGTGPSRQVPIIFLTARDETTDKVAGLRLGSDDYLTKPFSIEELAARVDAVLRRSGLAATATADRLEVAGLVLDDATHEVWRDGERIDLTATEFRLLHHLMRSSPRVVTRAQILHAVWDYSFTSNASVLDTYISYLRQKVDAGRPALIQTVRGVGYSLRPPRD